MRLQKLYGVIQTEKEPDEDTADKNVHAFVRAVNYGSTYALSRFALTKKKKSELLKPTSFKLGCSTRLNCRIPCHTKTHLESVATRLRSYTARKLSFLESVAARLRRYAATQLRSYAATELHG